MLIKEFAEKRQKCFEVRTHACIKQNTIYAKSK